MRIRKPVAIGAVTAIVGLASAALVTLPASATSNPPWEPDPNALGTLTFYNSAGQVVTGGSNLNHLFDYALASSADSSGGIKAVLYFAAPTPNEATGLWFSSQASPATAFPNASAPSPLNTATNPVVSLTATAGNLTNFIQQVVPQTAAGYANVYQVRAYTIGLGGKGTLGQGTYWDADVLVNPTAGTWQEVYPTQGTSGAPTTTTMSAPSPNPGVQGSPVTLSATVAAGTTHPAGTVQFAQDGFAVGNAANVDTTTGVATTTADLLPSAPNGTQITAIFTPANSADFNPSVSAPFAYTVNPVAPTPALSGAHQAGQSETCFYGALDFGVTGTYKWLANGATIASGTLSSITGSAKLVVPGSAFNKALTCEVSVSDGSGPTSSATSNPVTVVLGAALTAHHKPTLSGPHKVGKVERVNPGTWSQKATFTYQWLLNGKVIRHATKSTFRPTRADKGKKLSCRVTAHVTGFANGSATTASVKVS